jgi:Fe-S oxidoreductase
MFDLFVLPFTVGLAFLLVFISWKFTSWVKALPEADRKKFAKSVFTRTSFISMKEIIMESLLHRKIFKVNPRLGYMHMSLAFGWLLLILAGNLESRLFHHGEMSAPYVPIFFRFFHPNPVTFEFHKSFAVLMDLLLVFVLSGVALAYYKRLNSKFLGLKKTTKHVPGDRIALTALWFIFPLRLLAESFTSGVFGGGSFLTNSLGNFLVTFLPSASLYYAFWWAYSVALGAFFVALPFSRYMHIPTETLLIFLRNTGVKESVNHTGFTDVELNACSRCGVCIDTCQLSSAAAINNIQSVYQLRDIRYHTVNAENSLNCLMCGRCDQTCPVGIDISGIRQIKRCELNPGLKETFEYVKTPVSHQTDVIYFAGCMSHLTPSIKKSVVQAFKKSGVNFWFMDEHESICCGRPLLLAGKKDEAQAVMNKNKTIIEGSNAKALVTNCPICYKMFSEQYQLDIPVYHHSQYFAGMIENNLLKLKKHNINAVYHDPCELGRGSKVYDEPRKVLSNTVNLVSADQEKENGLCCGGSLGNMTSSIDDRNKITREACSILLKDQPDILVTSCPLCKKTFQKVSNVPVYDIAEIVNGSIISKKGHGNMFLKHEPSMLEEIMGNRQ